MAITGRKAIFFSASALLVVGIILATVGQQATQRDSEPELIRIGDISRDVTLLEANTLPKILQTKSYNALAAISRQAQMTPYSSQSQIQGDFNNCVVNDICPGSPAGTQIAQLNQLGTLYGQTQQYSTSTFQLQSVQLQERGPYEVYVIGTFVIQLQEASGAAGYTTTKTIATSVPLDGLLDPYASAQMGQNRYIAFARRGVFGDPLASQSSWTTTTSPNADFAVKSALNGYYQPDPNGPSYLERLTNNPQPSAISGIHSLIPVVLPSQTSVDYAMTPPSNACLLYIDIPGTSSRVQFTQQFLILYRLGDPIYETLGIVRRGQNCP